MGLFDFLNKSNDNQKEMTPESNKVYKERVIVSPFPFNVETRSMKELTYRERESLLDRFDNYADKFLCAADEIRYEFEFGRFDYKARLKLINKACKAFDKAFEIAAPYWYEDWIFMDTLELTEPNQWTVKECPDDNPKNVLEIDDNPSKYTFNNINFLRWILSEYEKQEDDIKKALKERENKLLV